MNGTKSVRTRKFLGTIDRIMLPAALAAIFTIIIEWGWSGTLGAVATTVILILNALVIALFIFESLAKALLAPSVVRHVRENTFEVSITVIFILFLAAGKAIHNYPPVNGVMMSLGLDLGGFYLITGQVYLVLSVLMKTITFQKHLTSAGIRPADRQRLD